METIDKIKEKKKAIKLARDIVQDFFEVDVTKKTRERKYILARSFGYKILKDNTKMTLTEIGKAFKKNHATVLHNLRQLDGYLDYDMGLATDYLSLNSLFVNSMQIDLIDKYDEQDEEYYEHPKYMELVRDFRELSNKYVKMRSDYDELAMSSKELSVKHKNMSELFYKREKFFKTNGYIL